jgi:hypothetical protein
MPTRVAAVEPVVTGERVRVSALDRLHSHRRTGVVIGPVELPPTYVLADRYARLVEAGPLVRLCLEPSVRSTRWRRRLDDGVSLTDVSAPLPPVTMLDVTRAACTDDVADGIRILRAGEYLAIDFCHGLGEVPLVNLILDVLFGVTDPSDPALVDRYSHRVAPLISAAAKTFGTDPRRITTLLRRRPVRAAAPEMTTYPRPPTPRPATSFVGLPADVATELRRQRDAALPGVSLAALFTYALWECLADSGLRVDDVVKIPFDVRPYLPAGSNTLSPLTAGLDFDVGRCGGPAGLQAEMDRSARSGQPVANLAVSALKALVPRHDTHGSWPAHPRVHLLHSNVRLRPGAGGWPFSDPARAQLLVASDPATPHGVTVTSAWLMDTLWLTARFDGGVFDAELVATALSGVTDRVRRLLGPGSRP